MSVLTVEQVRELLESGHTDAEIGAMLGVPRMSILRFRHKYGITGGRVGVNKAYGRDLTAPKDDGTTRLYPVKVGKPSLRIDLSALRDDLVAEIREISRARKGSGTGKPVTLNRPPSLLHVVTPVDLHVGKLAWHGETGEDFDSGIAADRLTGAIEKLLGYASPYQPDSQLLVVGNDLMQVDNLLSATTAGTLQDTDSRYRKMFRVSVRLMAQTIDRMRQVAPLKVLVVPGNHDSLATFHLGEVLQAMYGEVRGVEIDASLLPRLYHTHGKNLLGFCHGNEEAHHTLPLIMAQEMKAAWAVTTYREWLIGHFHKRKQAQFVAGDSFNGVKISTCPSLSGTDFWHSKKGYVAEPKASESRLYDATDGPIATFTATMVA